jgi:enterochelin esterase family protein
VPRGTVEHCRYRSERLADERDLWVYLPPAPPEGLLVVFDGRSYTTVIPTPTILDNLLAAGHIPPLAAVLLQSPGDSEVEQRKARTWELSCNPDFADFLADELLPWVRQNFGVPTPQELTLTAGSSLGGLAAVYAAYRRPEVFGRALSLSGSFWWKPESGTDTAMATEEDEEWEWLTRQLVAAERLPVRFYVNVGILETDAPAGMPSQVTANRHLRDVLLARGHQVHYAEYAGQHDYACWRGTLADGLIALFA